MKSACLTVENMIDFRQVTRHLDLLSEGFVYSEQGARNENNKKDL